MYMCQKALFLDVDEPNFCKCYGGPLKDWKDTICVTRKFTSNFGLQALCHSHGKVPSAHKNFELNFLNLS